MINLERFNEIVSEEFNLPKAEITGEVIFRNIDTWSSLHALLFIARINDEVGVMLSSSDLATCSRLEDIYKLIISK